MLSSGQAFEDLFTKFGKRRWGPEFEPWKPQGHHGDFKCDGYLAPEETVFQCYAPEHQRPSDTHAKIRHDFAGARAHFTHLAEWVFVYNQPDLPAKCGMLLKQLRRENIGVKITTWVQSDIIDFAMRLAPLDLAIIFPELSEYAESASLRETGNNSIMVAEFATGDGSNRDASFNLNQALNTLSDRDREIRRRILGASVWLDPMSIERGIALLQDNGFAETEINLNIERLREDELIQVTADYILPKYREVCGEAAGELAEEFIEMLGIELS